MSYEIRVYYKRYNVSPDYYMGDKGIKRRWKAQSGHELVEKWKLHLADFEGDTYSVWHGNECIIGGAYDPSDDDYIYEYLSKDITDTKAEGFWKDLIGTLWGNPETKTTHGIMSSGLIADHMGISYHTAECFLRACRRIGVTERQGGAWVV